MKIQATEKTFAGLMATCPHCYLWAFPHTIQAHVPSFKNSELNEMFTVVKGALKVYVAEAKASGRTEISLYGQDLGTMFQTVKSEMLKRELIE